MLKEITMVVYLYYESKLILLQYALDEFRYPLSLIWLIYRNAYQTKKKERPPFLPEEKLPEPKKEEIPAELLCPLCRDLLSDAVLIPCCGTSFCDDCK